MFSAIKVKSGSIIDTGRSIAFRFSGSSLRPAYPGFIVTNIPHVRISRISTPTDGILTYKMIAAGILSNLAHMWTFGACRMPFFQRWRMFWWTDTKDEHNKPAGLDTILIEQQIKLKSYTHKNVSVQTSFDSLHDCGDLGCYHRENLNFNPVELIKASPCSCLWQPGKHCSSHLVVHSIWAVEHNNIPAWWFRVDLLSDPVTETPGMVSHWWNEQFTEVILDFNGTFGWELGCFAYNAFHVR